MHDSISLGLAVYSYVYQTVLVNILIYTVGMGFCVYGVSGLAFWMMPFLGPALFLSLVGVTVTLLIECTLSISLHLAYLSIPLSAGLIVGFVAYSIAGVSTTRDSFFVWPASGILRVYHAIVTSLVSAFLLTTSILYFSTSTNDNIFALLVTQLGLTFGTCDSTNSGIAAACIIGGGVAISLTRTVWFEQSIMHKIGLKFYRVTEDHSVPKYNPSTSSSFRSVAEGS
jgi:hypothetical protein